MSIPFPFPTFKFSLNKKKKEIRNLIFLLDIFLALRMSPPVIFHKVLFTFHTSSSHLGKFILQQRNSTFLCKYWIRLADDFFSAPTMSFLKHHFPHPCGLRKFLTPRYVGEGRWRHLGDNQLMVLLLYLWTDPSTLRRAGHSGSPAPRGGAVLLLLQPGILRVSSWLFFLSLLRALTVLLVQLGTRVPIFGHGPGQQLQLHNRKKFALFGSARWLSFLVQLHLFR